MRMVTPRFVEIVALSIETALRKIIIAGAAIMIATTRAAIRMRLFVPTILSAHMTAMMIAISKKRGCIKVASANQPPTDATAIQNFLSIGLLKVERIVPAIIMKQAAIGVSYPTDIDESESVGLKERIIDVQKAKYFKEVLRNLFVKK